MGERSVWVAGWRRALLLLGMTCLPLGGCVDEADPVGPGLSEVTGAPPALTAGSAVIGGNAVFRTGSGCITGSESP
jgi:hypothetical protein